MDEIKLDAVTPAEAPAEGAGALEQVTVVDIQFRTGSKVYFFDPGRLTLKAGDHVIIDTARGPEYGLCAAGPHPVSKMEIVPPLRPVIRLATAADERTVAENREKEKRAYEICQQKIAEHKLDMQLVSAEYAFDGSKILFFFTADDRVDFRELVRNLASIFRTRIELRQIGVRDKAKMVGGLGICGRPFCCKQFLDDFQPVSIKMAKTQNLSLNPTKISGTCGRLMCCLKYEQAAYEDLIRTSPKADSFVDTPDGRGTVTEVNLLRQSVKVRMEEQPEEIGCYKNCEICVLRNGKAKKNDPPIPADLAPISGGGKRPKKQEEPEEHMTLDPIRFRYRSDEIVPEAPEEPAWTPPEEEAQLASQEAPDKKSQPRRKKKNTAKKSTQQAKEDTAEQKPKKDAAPKEAAKGGEGRKSNQNRKPRQPKPQERPAEAGAKPEGANPEGEKAAQSGNASSKNRNPRRRYRPRNRNNQNGQNNPGGQSAPPAQG